jgi:hypothetical protein
MILHENHRIEGLKRIGHQYAHSEKFWQFVTTTLEPLNNLEAVFLSLLDIDLDTAYGVVLDLLGRIVGAPVLIPDLKGTGSFTLDEEQYRLAIKAQILKNSSDCTPDNIIEIIQLLTKAPFTYLDGDMWIGLGLSTVKPMTILEMCLIKLFIPRPAGVGIRFFGNWYESFGWVDQLDSLGFGEIGNPEVGGYWIEEVY